MPSAFLGLQVRKLNADTPLLIPVSVERASLPVGKVAKTFAAMQRAT
jgi:hypothetical protein